MSHSDLTLAPPARLLTKLVPIRPHELRAALLSAAYFFAVLCAYYIVRPIREEMGVRVGREHLPTLFTVVLVVMIAAVPAFGWVVTRFPRLRVVPVMHGFFILNLTIFWMLLSANVTSPILAGTFFVWVSVFNLFVVSLFWSVMADLWHSDQAKRIYGFIAAGGSAGAFCGPLVTQSLVTTVGATNLLLVSGTLLAAALAAAMMLRRELAAAPPAGDGRRETSSFHDLFAGAINVWKSPYLFRIALVMLLVNLISTFFYLEQNRIVGTTISSTNERVQLFARIDLAVSILTIAAQLLLTGRIMQRLGLSLTASILPAVTLVFLIALAIAPTLWVVVGAIVVERAVGFAFANPALRVFFTVVDEEDKYKAQSFIDTVVFRSGDAGSAWLLNAATRSIGLPVTAVALLSIPLAAWWLSLAWRLGAEQSELARRQTINANLATPG